MGILFRETYPLTNTMPNSWQAQAVRLLCSFAVLATALPLAGQTPYIASTRAQALQAAGVQISGDVHVANGAMELGNGSTITAGNETVPIALNRGGELKLCATTSIHLARDRSIQAPDASGLMLGLDRGAIEAQYETSKYSDVLLTPDLRILISGPGTADLSIRVSRQGDTCIDNRGSNAPYITVTSQLEGGLYRVQPGQHVSFQHGSLREVVDTEHEPCGCPAPVSVADAGSSAPIGAAPGHPVGGPSSTPADTAFPLAVSEGLTNAPLPPATPVASPGRGARPSRRALSLQRQSPHRQRSHQPSRHPGCGSIGRHTVTLLRRTRSFSIEHARASAPTAAARIQTRAGRTCTSPNSYCYRPHAGSPAGHTISLPPLLPQRRTLLLPSLRRRAVKVCYENLPELNPRSTPAGLARHAGERTVIGHLHLFRAVDHHDLCRHARFVSRDRALIHVAQHDCPRLLSSRP